ncbi:MAG TPA: bifunctional diguanylate cyclase/phosphodiesterase [Pseudomonas xinjiangensis]|uniref:Bifunctional diguanylate cyclase/phosphodiesterase n=2 Tax=root TaxID=1 RepID=A0A7V1FQE8_9GAMM|nr:bifunctional diguanylate cyclase/phosphodiesterase [Halopseudomonas xinjiangensis]HEC47536.1 bifunctional diguanylate cyclase/phosphodiesterase [Halopseudomonas xinjiangensis]
MALRRFRNFRIQRSIMLILLLLIGVFIVGMVVMSSLNLNFAQSAMAELRQKQISDTFYANLNRINAHHQLMEQNTANLARAGELLYRTNQRNGNVNAAELGYTLQTALEQMHDAHGAEIWFNGAATDSRKSLSAYGYRDGSSIQIQNDENLYHTQDWYRRILPEAMGSNSERVPDFFWTPAYYKELISNVVISLTTVMRDLDGNVIGLASTDWRADEIIRLVSRVEVTPGTFAFLLDSENRNLSSLATSGDLLGAQEKIDAIIDSKLQNRIVGPLPQSAIVSGRILVAPMQTMSLRMDDVNHALFFSRTQAGLIFGVGVPQAEIDAVLVPMRESNFKIVGLISTLVLWLAGLILFIVASILRRVHTLYTDNLTDLPNREKLLVDLQKADSASLILINIDAFKEINDFYGHQCGDHVISELANSLQRFLTRQSEWVGSRLYRMPADELAIWLPKDSALDSLSDRTKELVAFASTLKVTWEMQTIPLQVTLGVATSVQRDGGQLTDEQLLTSASIALKSARQNKLSSLIYDPAQKARESYEHNLIWANRLRKALDEGRIVPYFQPIMDLNTGRIDKFECLARMIDEQGEPISPTEFLEVAKKIRLYRHITRTMVQQCFSRFADNQYEFSLNLSCEDLLDPELTTFIVNSLGQSDLASRVIFEILESEGIENYAAVRTFIDRVKALGCRIAIDDFGTGYSNFEHLLRLNVDIIKIDGSLVKQLDTDPTALTVTRGINQFAHGLCMRTVAEFVHSPGILEKVKALGIDYAQGYHIGHPSATLVTEREPGEELEAASAPAQILTFSGR